MEFEIKTPEKRIVKKEFVSNLQLESPLFFKLIRYCLFHPFHVNYQCSYKKCNCSNRFYTL